MSTDQFNEPASTSGLQWAELKGSLLLFDVQAVEHGIKTTYGETDAVRADVTVLDGDQAGTEYTEALVFPRVLQSQLRSSVGQKVLGRLGQGTQKPGQSPPWLLATATDADKATAREHLAKKTQPAFAAPAQGSPPF